MNAQPGPIVSGKYFFPNAPLLCVKWMPAWAVTSRKVICWAQAAPGMHKEMSKHAVNKLMKSLACSIELAVPEGQEKPSHQEPGHSCAVTGAPCLAEAIFSARLKPCANTNREH